MLKIICIFKMFVEHSTIVEKNQKNKIFVEHQTIK